MNMESSRQILSALQTACDRADMAGDEETASLCETAIGHVKPLDDYATLISRLEDLAEWNETTQYAITAEQTTADSQTLTLAYGADNAHDIVATAASPSGLLAEIDKLGLWR